MASKYEHPFRVQAGRLPTFKTQHHAYDFLAEYQAGGHIRPCAHARVRGTGSGGWNEGYIVYCEKDSFEIVPVRALGAGDNSRGFNGCPKGCHLYRPRWRAKLSQWRRNRHPTIWFGMQPWQVKVTLIAALVVLVAIYLGALKDLATLARTIGEIWHGK
jgi:hypothetical protein